jgi:hypothetical protein
MKREAPPGGAGDAQFLINGADRRNSNATLRYLQGRERILGGVWIHRDPDLAWQMLCDQLGKRAARLWLAALLEVA